MIDDLNLLASMNRRTVCSLGVCALCSSVMSYISCIKYRLKMPHTPNLPLVGEEEERNENEPQVIAGNRKGNTY